MTDNSYLDFYDCNSSSNSLLKFDTLSPTLSPVSSNSTFTQKMDALSNNNPLLTTASMPIPMRNAGGNANRTMNEFSEFGFGSGEKSQSPIDGGVNLTDNNGGRMHSNVTLNYQGLGVNTNNAGIYNIQSMNFANPQMWDEMSGLLSAANTMTQDKSGPFQMDEDLSDIFQVDKSDLIQGPTLAELNDTGDTNLYIDLLDMEEDVMLSDMQQSGQIMNPNHQFSQLTSSNFHNLQSAINESSGNCLDLPQQMFQTINITQTPHNTPCNSYQSTMLYYDETNQPPSSPYDNYSSPTSNARIQQTQTAFSPSSHGSSSSLLVNSLSPPPSMPTQSNFSQQNNTGRSPRSTRSVGLVQHNPKYSTLHELLLKRDHNSLSPEQRKSRNSLSLAHSSPPTQLLNNNPALSPGGYSRRNMSGGTVVSRLSSSAPTHLGLEQIWQRREPRQHLLSTGSLAEGGSTSSLSGALSPEAVDFSTDDINFSSDEDDSEHYEDLTSDNDSDNEDNKDMSIMGLGSDNNNNAHFKGYSSGKKNRFFWQYNVQAKGPKGQRLVIKTQVEDPHFLNEVTDPVFSPNCSVRGIKHSGKARKGDGNDLTPNAKKLNSIGKELEKLSSVINDMTPVSELPINVRPKTRKEKNKLASRACRLKKKAQHEANKIKLYGLEHEHKRLIYGINQMKQLVALKCSSSNDTQEDMNQRIEQVVSKATAIRIADNSTEYVNRVLERIKSGIPSGGLDDF